MAKERCLAVRNQHRSYGGGITLPLCEYFLEQLLLSTLSSLIAKLRNSIPHSRSSPHTLSFYVCHLFLLLSLHVFSLYNQQTLTHDNRSFQTHRHRNRRLLCSNRPSADPWRAQAGSKAHRRRTAPPVLLQTSATNICGAEIRAKIQSRWGIR